MKYYAIIVAGGSGKRMNADLPKQFHLLLGKPVLMHTLEAFYYSKFQPMLLLVLNTNYQSLWKDLCIQYKFDIPHVIITGGAERFDSVKNALDSIDDPQNAFVAVHDAVRPLTSDELITRCYEEAQKKGAVIPVVESRDSLRRKVGEKNVAINRDEILIVQTPQVFKAAILKNAYTQSFNSSFTDDASVVEKAGYKIFITPGDPQNMKITYNADIAIASLYLSKEK